MFAFPVHADEVFVLADGVTSFLVEEVFSDGFIGGSIGSAETPFVLDRYLEISPGEMAAMGMRRVQ